MSKRSDEDILATARKRYKLVDEAESQIREEARIDIDFCAGNQWTDEDRLLRTQSGRRGPCLTFNKLAGPLNMTANDARMNKSGILVHPVDSESDPDTAKVIEGMIRHIEYASNADEAHETAIEHSTSCGFGYFKCTLRYTGENSFDQELLIERIPDQFAVRIDPYAKRADKSDMRWAFETMLLSRDEYKEEYPDSETVQCSFWDYGTNPSDGWISTDGVRIATYWEIEHEPRSVVGVQWPDGKVTAQAEDELPDELPDGLQYATDRKGKPLRRDLTVPVVRWYKLDGCQIHDRGEWPGKWIPIFPVLGKEMYIRGRRHLYSLVRFSRDAQRLYNYYRSSEAEVIALGTKAPWIGVKGIFKDPRWATANIVPWSYLEYEPLDISGQPAPPPTRNIFEPPIQAFSAGALQASDDIKSTTNVFDASLGARSNETSGVAIQRRQNQAGLANYHFIDNLNRAILQCGKVLCDLIPKVYSTAREVRILGDDRKEQIVKVNQQYVDKNGRSRNYQLGAGTYDVAVTVGPSYATQRQESLDLLTQLTQAYPQIMGIAGDIIFSNADVNGADKIAERFRKTLPPALQDSPDGAPPVPPQAAAQMAQQSQMIQAMQAELQKQKEELMGKVVQHQADLAMKQMEIESSDRQAALNAQVQLVTAELKAASAENIEMLRQQVKAIQAQIAQMSTGAAAQRTEAEIAGPAPVNGQPTF